MARIKVGDKVSFPWAGTIDSGIIVEKKKLHNGTDVFQVKNERGVYPVRLDKVTKLG